MHKLTIGIVTEQGSILTREGSKRSRFEGVLNISYKCQNAHLHNTPRPFVWAYKQVSTCINFRCSLYNLIFRKPLFLGILAEFSIFPVANSCILPDGRTPHLSSIGPQLSGWGLQVQVTKSCPWHVKALHCLIEKSRVNPDSRSPCYLQHMYTDVPSVHNINTRSHNLNFKVQSIKGIASKCFSFQAVKFWNCLPSQLKYISSYALFKHRIKKHLSSVAKFNQDCGYVFTQGSICETRAGPTSPKTQRGMVFELFRKF